MEKNRLKKVRKHVFFNKKYCDQKMGEKKREIFFSWNGLISKAKNDGKNRLEKVRKHVFSKHTIIVTKKWGKKRERKISRNNVFREL